jgi:GT2 family glycosyltransferase
VPSPPRISVVVVTYNSAAHLRPALEAALTQDYPDYEVLLRDNASRDDSLAIARQFEPRGLRVVAGVSNRGFAGGNNDAIAATDGALIVLLNPDAVLAPDGLTQIALAFASRPDMGILGAKLVDPDGVTLQHCGGRIGIPAHCSLYGRGEPDRGQWDQPMEVELVIGALLAIRRANWDRLGGFD